jgi:hypothetical protein
MMAEGQESGELDLEKGESGRVWRRDSAVFCFAESALAFVPHHGT